MKKIFQFDLRTFSDLSSMDEFYHRVPGLYDEVVQNQIPYSNLYMNRKSCERLLDYMLSKVPEGSVEKFRWDIVCSYDWLNHSPNVSLCDVPANEVWVLTGSEEGEAINEFRRLHGGDIFG